MVNHDTLLPHLVFYDKCCITGMMRHVCIHKNDRTHNLYGMKLSSHLITFTSTVDMKNMQIRNGTFYFRVCIMRSSCTVWNNDTPFCI